MFKVGQRYMIEKDVEYIIHKVSKDGNEGIGVNDVFPMMRMKFNTKDVIDGVITLVKPPCAPLAIRIYLAHPISNTYEAEASIATANRLRDSGFEVYAAAENSAINDKTNDPTPMDIYNADIEQLEACDIVVVNITGGHQDGTIFEVGYACALGKKILGYTTNSRLRNPQIYKGIPSAKANHLVIGGVEVKGEWCGTFEGVLEELGK